MLPPSVDYLGHIETKDEAEWNEADAILAVDTEAFKIQFHHFILAKYKPVKHTYHSIQGDIYQKPSPYSLEYTSFPNRQKSSKSSHLTSCVDMLNVGDRHP